jgi:hypothetical protein
MYISTPGEILQLLKKKDKNAIPIPDKINPTAITYYILSLMPKSIHLSTNN